MTGSNWWVNSFPGAASGGAAYGGGGGYAGNIESMPRDSLDAKRLANQVAPGGSYPDGYLGTITGRRDDKLLTSLQSKLSSKSYQRGVHKGDKVGTSAYFWDDKMSPDMGLERQAQTLELVDVEGGMVMMTQRFAPTGDPIEYLAHDGKTAGMLDREAENRARAAGVDPAKNPPLTYSNPARAARIQANMPRWR